MFCHCNLVAVLNFPVAVISITLFRLWARVGGRDATILEHNLAQTAGSAGESLAFGVGVTMLVAIYLRHWDYGYLMNWHGKLPFGTEGWEYHTLAIGMSLALMLEGAGAFAIDSLLARLTHKPAENYRMEPSHA